MAKTPENICAPPESPTYRVDYLGTWTLLITVNNYQQTMRYTHTEVFITPQERSYK